MQSASSSLRDLLGLRVGKLPTLQLWGLQGEILDAEVTHVGPTSTWFVYHLGVPLNPNPTHPYSA